MMMLILAAPDTGGTFIVPQQSAEVVVHSDAQGARAVSQRDAGADVPMGGGIAGVVDADWAALGPFGGDIDDVNVSPVDANIVLAGLAPATGSGGTLYRSTDGGFNWNTVAALANQSVYDIEFASDGTAYIGTLNSVWKSTDGGASWTQLSLGIGLNDQVFEVTIDPADESVVWIGIADALGSQPVNVMRSDDAGATWDDMTPPLGAAQSCRGIAFKPGDSDSIYAAFGGAFGGGQVWVTTNGGANWINRSAGLPNNPMNDIVHDGTRVLVTGGQNFGSQFVGLYESTNDGMTWNALHDGTWPNNLGMNDVEFDPADPQIMFVASAGVGLIHSDDGGSTWTLGAGGADSLSLLSVRFAPGSSSHIVVGGSSVAVLQSDDGGESFSNTSTGIGALNVVSIAANPLNCNELAIAFQGLNDGGVYTSLDGGATWFLEPVPGTRYNTVGFNFEGVLYAISDGPTSIAPEALYRRESDGTWTSLGPDQGNLFESELFALAFSPNDPLLIMTGGSDFGVAGAEPTVWRTVDGGDEWEKTYEGPIPNEDVTDIEILPDGTDLTMIASFTDFGVDQTGGVLRSDDGGQSWSDSSTGLPAVAQCAALSPIVGDAQSYYLANNDFGVGNGGVYRTSNGGQSWSNTGLIEPVGSVAADPVDPGTVFIMQNSAPIVRVSTDGGATFDPFDAGLGSPGFGRALAIVGGVRPMLLLASSTGGFSTPLSDVGFHDFDGNATVDLADWQQLALCFQGQECLCEFDSDFSQTVDLPDAGDFVATMTGP